MSRKNKTKHYQNYWDEQVVRNIARNCASDFSAKCPDCGGEIDFYIADSEKDLKKKYVGKNIIVDVWCDICQKLGTQHFKI